MTTNPSSRPHVVRITDQDQDGPDRVVLAGDWHGNERWAVAVVDAVAWHGFRWIWQLGDFGITAGDAGERFLDEISAACERGDVHVAVTLGNHENYDLIDSWDRAAPAADRGDVAGLRLGAVHWIRDRIAVLPRPHRWQVTTTAGVTRTVASLGGAPSIDYPWRTRGVSWWPQEMVTLDQVDQAVAAGPVDVLLAHDAPDGASAKVRRIVGTPGTWSESGLRYAREGRLLMNVAFDGLSPSLYAHGHYHVADEQVIPRSETGNRSLDGECRFVALNADGMVGNVAVLDLDTLTVTWADRGSVL